MIQPVDINTQPDVGDSTAGSGEEREECIQSSSKPELGKDADNEFRHEYDSLEEDEGDDEFQEEMMMPLFGEGDFMGSTSPHEKGFELESGGSGLHFVHDKINPPFIKNKGHIPAREISGEQGDGPLQRDRRHRSTSAHLRRITSNDEPKPNIIVNYLPQTLTDKEFFHLFAPYGQMESIKIMRDSTTGYSFGYGFVNYIDVQDAIDARNDLNGTHLEHKRIKVSFARPPSDDIKDTNLFVTSLPTNITESELDNMFSKYGVIVHLRVLRDRITKASRGVAFVRYETRNQACSAIMEMNGYVPRGGFEGIRVRLAQDHGKQKAAYIAGYQAALKMKPGSSASGSVGVTSTRVPDIPFRHSETSFERRPCPRAVVHRRPMTSLNVGENIRVTNSLSDPTLYWRGFIQGAREPRRTESSSARTQSDLGRTTNSRSRY